MSLATNVTDLATRVATEAKALRTLINGNAADLSALNTTAKSTLIAAINEIEAAVSSASGIDDGTTSTTTTWSSDKITDYVAAEIAEVDVPVLTDLINDTTPSTSTTFSSTKIGAEIAAATSAATAALVDAAPGTLDTLNELAAALGDDPSFASTVTTALGNRVRTDTAAQGLNGTQQSNARTNIAAASASDLSTLTTNVGDTTTNFVTVFESGLI